MKKAVGIVHPGQMGISVAAALVGNGYSVYWASEGRSDASRARADKYGLQDTSTLAELCEKCELVFSVCPPDQAVNVATQVTKNNFAGIYVDCNAVSPDSANAVAEIVANSGSQFVDGGIIGLPAWEAGTTRLYLSGKSADQVAEHFSGSLLEGIAIGDSPGAASALKMAYAGWTKGSAALLLSTYALAERHGLGDVLKSEWSLSQAGLENKLKGAAKGNAPKAWRFVGEMHEIAASMKSASLPSGSFNAAAEIYQSLESFKNKSDVSPDDVISKILENGDS